MEDQCSPFDAVLHSAHESAQIVKNEDIEADLEALEAVEADLDAFECPCVEGGDVECDRCDACVDPLTFDEPEAAE
jgi:hypothetical protein